MTWNIITIPVEGDIKEANLSFEEIARYLGDGERAIVERVTTPYLHFLAHLEYNPETREGGDRYPSVVMLVDENFLITKTESEYKYNKRAQVFYPHAPILGNVVLVGEDEVEDEIEFASLPNIVTIDRVEKYIEQRLAKFN